MTSRLLPILMSACLLMAGACSSPSGSDPVAQEEGSDSEEEGNAEAGKGGPTKKGGTKPKRPGSKVKGSDTPGGSGTKEGVGQAPSGPAAASLEDPGYDTINSGESPGFVDIRVASIRDEGDSVRMELVSEGDFPETLDEEDSYAVVEFRIEGGKNDVSISAANEGSGWSPSLDGGDYKGSFEVRGPRVVFVLPWKAVGGNRKFRWAVGTSWSASTLTTTHYSFDQAPEDFARYPQN